MSPRHLVLSWMLALVVGCGEEQRVPAEVEPEIDVVLDHEVTASSPFAVARALRAWIRTDPDGSSRLIVDLAIDNDQAPRFDGAMTYPAAVGLQRDNLQLVVDGVSLPPNPTDQPGYLPFNITAPEVGTRRVRGLLAYDLPASWSPERIELLIDTQRGRLRLPLQGELALSDGTPAMAFEVVGSDLRPVAGAVVTLTSPSGELRLSRELGFDTWLIPIMPEATTLTLRIEAPGHRTLERQLTGAELAAMPTVQLARTETLWDADAGLSAILPAQPYPRHEVSVDGALDGLAGADAEAIGAWVRENIAVLPTHGVQRSPNMVVRQRAGNPVERALLAQRMLADIGIDGRLTCGDLLPEQAEAIFSAPPKLPVLEGRLGEEARKAVSIADGLQPGLEALLAARPTSGPARRERIALVPEWCWVQAKEEGRWTQLDLRPAPHHQTELPMSWRLLDKLRGETWRVAITLTAVYGEDEGEPDESIDLLPYQAFAGELSELAVVFDVWPEFEDGRAPQNVRTMISLIRPAGVETQVGRTLSVDRLQRIVMVSRWTDPLEVVTRETEVPLWEARTWREGEERRPLQQVRAVVSADVGVSSAGPLVQRVGEAFGGRHPTPAVQAILLRHDLFTLLRRHAAAGLTAAEPSLLVSVLDAGDAGHLLVFDDLYPPAPARAGGAGSIADQARLAAAGSAAHAVLLGLESATAPVPDPLPTAWGVDGAQLDPLQGYVRSRVRRSMDEQGNWVAISPTGEAWTFDLAAAAFGRGPHAPRQVDTPLASPLGDEVRAEHTARAHSRWDRPLRCVDAPIWRDLLYGDRVRATGCTDVTE